MSDHEHQFEGALWHRVATSAKGATVWVRLCTVGPCSADEEFIGELPSGELTSVSTSPTVTDVTPPDTVEGTGT